VNVYRHGTDSLEDPGKHVMSKRFYLKNRSPPPNHPVSSVAVAEINFTENADYCPGLNDRIVIRQS